MLLCDWADALNGKLYIGGGGWDRVFKVQPLGCSVAVMLSVPWHATNEKHVFRLTLQTEDGVVVKDAQENRFEIVGEFETGRPAGTKPGSPIRTPLTFRVQQLDLAVGGYAFVLEVDETEITRAQFTVAQPPAGMAGLPGAQQ